jgi:hypothetical protein
MEKCEIISSEELPATSILASKNPIKYMQGCVWHSTHVGPYKLRPQLSLQLKVKWHETPYTLGLKFEDDIMSQGDLHYMVSPQLLQWMLTTMYRSLQRFLSDIIGVTKHDFLK